MKKRGVLLVLLLSLLAPAALAQEAYTLPQVIGQAKEGWHRSYQAHGRSITVDITPLLPEAERFPVLRCTHKNDWDLVPRDEQYHPLTLGGGKRPCEHPGRFA